MSLSSLVSKSSFKNNFQILIALSVVAGALTPAARADTATAAAATGSSSATSASTLSLIKEKFAVSYDNYMNGPTFTESSGESINHYLAVKYKLPESQFIGFIFRADTNFDSTNKLKNGNKLADSYLRYRYPNFLKTGTVQAFGDVRYYFPISEASQKKELTGKVVSRVYTTANVGRLEMTNILIPTYFLNNLSNKGQDQFDLTNYFETKLRLTKTIALLGAVAPGWTYGRDIETQFNDMPTDAGFSLDFTENFSISPYVEFMGTKPEKKTTNVVASVSLTLL